MQGAVVQVRQVCIFFMLDHVHHADYLCTVITFSIPTRVWWEPVNLVGCYHMYPGRRGTAQNAYTSVDNDGKLCV